MHAQGLDQEIGTFSEEYNHVFNALSGRSSDGSPPRDGRLAALDHAPCITVRPDGSVICLQSPAEIERFFQTVADTHYREGYRSSRFTDLEVVPVGGRSVLASVTCSLFRDDGSLLKQRRQSYNLVRGDKEWRILASTFHVN